MDVPPAVAKAIMKDILDLQRSPIDGVEVVPSDDVSQLEARIAGPVDTPFEGGVFQVKLLMDSGYPTVPPRGFFGTKIFHPNVSEPKGEICVNTLKKDWVSTLGLRHVLMVIRCLLIEPNPESALNEEAGMMLLSNYAEYSRRATLLTQIHAKPVENKENPAAPTTPTDPSVACGSPFSTPTSVKKTATPLAQKAINKDRKKTLKRL
eukprot:TRINITY_DN2613_c9_g1_i1.p1 TRINITY_DN2613_c9_g1~~TRINITY_DN2613_c9_g1_i1.p1  ORF type:complete len:207 (+),score=54.55 TRINITY_DN2613_c9_g1_i1:152-772(+)